MLNEENRVLIKQWAQDKTTALDLQQSLSLSDSELATVILQFVVSHKQALNLKAIIQKLWAAQIPEFCLTLGFIWLWPRLSSAHHLNLFKEVFETEKYEDIYAFFFDKARGQLSQKFTLTGYTVQESASISEYLCFALLERAMNTQISWHIATWEKSLLPQLKAPVLWEVLENDQTIKILYGPFDKSAATTNIPGKVVRYGEHLLVEVYQKSASKLARQELKVRVCHSVNIAAARRKSFQGFITQEPFQQIYREIFRPSDYPHKQRLVKAFRKKDIESVVLFGYLRKRGWRRGEIMDFPRFFEMALEIPEIGWRPYIRFFPGMYASGPEQNIWQYIHVLGFQKITEQGPMWGNDFMQSSAFVKNGKPNGLNVYLDFPKDFEHYLDLYTLEYMLGEVLTKVPKVVYSETFRSIQQVYEQKGVDAQWPVCNSSRPFKKK